MSWDQVKHDAAHKTKGPILLTEWGLCRKVVLGQKRLSVNREEAYVGHEGKFRLLESIPFLPAEEVVKVKKATLESMYKHGAHNCTFKDHRQNPRKGLIYPNCPFPTNFRVEFIGETRAGEFELLHNRESTLRKGVAHDALEKEIQTNNDFRDYPRVTDAIFDKAADLALEDEEDARKRKAKENLEKEEKMRLEAEARRKLQEELAAEQDKLRGVLTALVLNVEDDSQDIPRNPVLDVESGDDEKQDIGAKNKRNTRGRALPATLAAQGRSFAGVKTENFMALKEDSRYGVENTCGCRCDVFPSVIVGPCALYCVDCWRVLWTVVPVS
jgi:hypothetical protein